MLCFNLYLRAISKYKAPQEGGGGAYLWRGDLTEGFLCYEFGCLHLEGLYIEGLIFGILRYFRGGNRDFRNDLGQSGLKGFRFQTGTDKCLRMKTIRKRYMWPSMFFFSKKRKDIRFQIKNEYV